MKRIVKRGNWKVFGHYPYSMYVIDVVGDANNERNIVGMLTKTLHGWSLGDYDKLAERMVNDGNRTRWAGLGHAKTDLLKYGFDLDKPL